MAIRNVSERVAGLLDPALMQVLQEHGYGINQLIEFARALVSVDAGTPVAADLLPFSDVDDDDTVKTATVEAVLQLLLASMFSSATPASGDELLFSDTSDSGATKRATIADILALGIETGTWTVSLHDAQSGGNASPTTVTGNYFKIGELVHASFNQLNNIDTTGMTAGNTLTISLPFTPSEWAVGSVRTAGFNLQSREWYVSLARKNNPRAQIGGNDAYSYRVTDISSGVSDIGGFTVVYRTDS